jgi:hypothetical protein
LEDEVEQLLMKEALVLLT